MMPPNKCKCEDCEFKESALKMSKCVCVVTHSSKGNQETQGNMTLVSTNEFSEDSSMVIGTGLGGSWCHA